MQYDDENINLTEKDWNAMANEYEKISPTPQIDFEKFLMLIPLVVMRIKKLGSTTSRR